MDCGQRLLLIEDDASIREIVSIGLQAAGFRVVTAVNVQLIPVTLAP